MTKEHLKSEREMSSEAPPPDDGVAADQQTSQEETPTQDTAPDDVFSEPDQDTRSEGEGVTGEDERSPLEAELQTLQEEMDQVRDQHLRLAADFENYRKRVASDLSTGWVRAQADLVRSLVEGLDDLQRVSQFTSEDTTVDALIEGVDLVERKILKALTDAGLEVLVPEGEIFNPNTMEAMMRVPTEEPGQDEMVHQVFQKGYVFKDQLVRPARVSVFKDDD